MLQKNKNRRILKLKFEEKGKIEEINHFGELGEMKIEMQKRAKRI